jgi:hypothetical protein
MVSFSVCRFLSERIQTDLTHSLAPLSLMPNSPDVTHFIRRGLNAVQLPQCHAL